MMHPDDDHETKAPPLRFPRVLGSITDTIGQTPCIRLTKVPQSLGITCEIVAKCEFLNPFGSVKDRIARSMIFNSKATGLLKPEDTVVEASSGNTGIALAAVGAAIGQRVLITMPVKMSQEKESMIMALGADVVRTPMVPFDHPESLLSRAQQLCDEHQGTYHWINQYTSEWNWRAHYEETGEEIYAQCEGRLDVVVLGCGTGGTMTGVARKLREKNPAIKIVCVDPVGSLLADPQNRAALGPYQVEGIGYDFVPDTCDRSLVDEWIKVNDQDAFTLSRQVIKDEALLVGGSSGTALAGAFQVAKRLGPDQRVVVVLPDGVRNYMTKFMDDNWMKERGFFPGEPSRPSLDTLQEENRRLREQLAQARAELEAHTVPQSKGSPKEESGAPTYLAME